MPALVHGSGGSAQTAASLGIPASGNASEFLVDRHFAAARHDKVAIECADQRITYAHLDCGERVATDQRHCERDSQSNPHPQAQWTRPREERVGNWKRNPREQDDQRTGQDSDAPQGWAPDERGDCCRSKQHGQPFQRWQESDSYSIRLRAGDRQRSRRYP